MRMQIGKYKIIERLGVGGSAQVYLGCHKITQDKAAIKLMNSPFESEDPKNLFLKEAELLKRLEHSSIVRIFDTGFHNSKPFIIMQYAPYGNLRAKHPKDTILSPEAVLSYICQITNALDYLHCGLEKPIVHCDIKPENVLLLAENELLLSDFNVAKIMQTTHSQSYYGARGTIIYMSPEQFNGKPEPASDQYSLGAMIYELLCGVPPFVGESIPHLITQHLCDNPLPLCDRIPNITPSIDNVICKTLQKDPHNRFPSIIAFKNAFEDALTHPSYNLADNAKSTVIPESDREDTTNPSITLIENIDIGTKISATPAMDTEIDTRISVADPVQPVIPKVEKLFPFPLQQPFVPLQLAIAISQRPLTIIRSSNLGRRVSMRGISTLISLIVLASIMFLVPLYIFSQMQTSSIGILIVVFFATLGTVGLLVRILTREQ